MNIDNLVADTTHYSIKNQACYIVIYWGKLKSSSFKNASRAANLQLSLQKLDLKTSSEIFVKYKYIHTGFWQSIIMDVSRSYITTCTKVWLHHQLFITTIRTDL